MKVIIKTAYHFTIGLYLSDKEVKQLKKCLEERAFISVVMLNNGLEVGIQKGNENSMYLVNKDGRRVFDGVVDFDDLYKQIKV